MRRPWVTLLGCLIVPGLCAAGTKFPAVLHSPEQPRSGELVLVTVKAGEPAGPRGFTCEYQVVEPGHYTERADPAYRAGWIALPMNDEGRDGDARAADGVFTVGLPGSLQRHRRLVRYRIVHDGRVVAPDPSDAQANFAYFVYDGVPAWRAAIDPKSADPALRAPATFGAALMNSVQVYHFLARRDAVENTTWYQPANIRDETVRHEYTHTGTLIVDGRVYDHVRFRARGGEWRHAMGKNMWKFDFLRGHHLQARDDFGRPYDARWEKLNLGACIQQGNYHRRGEHGLFEAVTFGLFNLAGVPAPRTHYVHLRIIDQPEEAPANQYEGDFWGLYLATEEIDGRFLEEHGLPDGNLYKWDFGQPKPEHVASGAAADRSDVLQFVAAYQQPHPEDWWRQHVDLPRYFSYRSILECVHHYDIGAGKNYFYYFQPGVRQWMVLPWDVDLTWKDNMYGTGQEPFWRAGVLRRPEFLLAYQNRLRELRDLLFNPEQTGELIDECAAAISAPDGGASFVDADRAKWDYHPILSSRWVHPSKAGPGQFYLESPTRDFRGMVRLMKDYVISRGGWCDAQLLGGAAIPPAPTVAPDRPPTLQEPSLKFHCTLPAGSATPRAVQWRLAEITPGPVSKPLVPRHFEMDALWQAERTEPTGAVEISSKPLEAGRTYRVRARACDASGRCGHWSEPAQFSIPR